MPKYLTFFDNTRTLIFSSLTYPLQSSAPSPLLFALSTPPDAPRLTITSLRVEVKPLTPVNLSCTVSGFPAPRVWWTVASPLHGPPRPTSTIESIKSTTEDYTKTSTPVYDYMDLLGAWNSAEPRTLGTNRLGPGPGESRPLSSFKKFASNEHQAYHSATFNSTVSSNGFW